MYTGKDDINKVKSTTHPPIESSTSLEPPSPPPPTPQQPPAPHSNRLVLLHLLNHPPTHLQVGQWKRLYDQDTLNVWNEPMPINNGAALLAEAYPWEGRTPLLPGHIDGLSVPPGLLDTAPLDTVRSPTHLPTYLPIDRGEKGGLNALLYATRTVAHSNRLLSTQPPIHATTHPPTHLSLYNRPTSPNLHGQSTSAFLSFMRRIDPPTHPPIYIHSIQHLFSPTHPPTYLSTTDLPLHLHGQSTGAFPPHI